MTNPSEQKPAVAPASQPQQNQGAPASQPQQNQGTPAPQPQQGGKPAEKPAQQS